MIWLVTVALLAVHVSVSIAHDADECCRPKTIVSFNAALTPLVSLYESRRTQIAQAVKKTNADVVCLQEVRYEKDMRMILKELKRKYPFSSSFLHSSTRSSCKLQKPHRPETSPCSGPEYETLKQCIASACSSVPEGLLFALCAFNNCANELFTRSQECISCLGSSLVSQQAADALCATPGRFTRFVGEGLLLLSKRPIQNAKKVQFIPGIKQVIPRGILEVDVHKIGKVLCTHLTADLSGSGIPYIELLLTQNEGITSYVEQQTREIAKIDELYNDENVILAGDLNTGPAVPSKNVTANLPQNYDALIAQGFASPYVELDGRCTFCGDNLIASLPDNIIDHVLLRGFDAPAATRILDNGTNPLSDHYGVSVNVCPRRD